MVEEELPGASPTRRSEEEFEYLMEGEFPNRRGHSTQKKERQHAY